jgi:Uma2 family endonuclease
MSTVALLGLADHGRRMSEDEFAVADFVPGYKYEIIEGRLYVSPEPELPEVFLEKWLTSKLDRYAEKRPDVINFVTNRARVFLRSRPDLTVPEPDIAAYRNFPRHRLVHELRWRLVSPILVAEVLVESDPFKDLFRNVELYKDLMSIREYWILNGRVLAEEPTLTVYRRRGSRWQKPREIEFGETYTTPFLPGFRLIIDPRR